MKAKINFALALLGIFSMLVACDRPNCTNSNPVFTNNKPYTQIYKAELAKQLQTADKSKLTYWFNSYIQTPNRPDALLFDIQGGGLCAQMLLNVDDWAKLSELKTKKGSGFGGAEFKNLKYDIISDSSGIKFIFKDY